MNSTELAFVSSVNQAQSLLKSWEDKSRGDGDDRVVVCLDEALFTCDEAASLFSPHVKVVGRSELGLSSDSIFAEALALATDFFSVNEQTWPAKVDGWLLESYKRWMIYAVHSIRLMQAALNRFQPRQVTIPEYSPFALTLSPDTDPNNPLFFDLLPSFCRYAGVKVNGVLATEANWWSQKLVPLKYIFGEWTSRIRKTQLRTTKLLPRPVVIGNLDNDFHRQFDLNKLDRAESIMHAWVRGNEALIPVEKLIERFGVPSTTRFGWLYDGGEDFSQIACEAGVRVRLLAGMHYGFQSIGYRRRVKARLKAMENRYDLPWAELLLWNKLLAVHNECRVAAAFYCVFEYERARSMLRHSQPNLFVTSADHWPFLPHFTAARDLGIETLSTESGLSFLQDNFVQKQADIICLFGKSEVVRATGSRPDAKIIFGGDALVQNEVSKSRSQRPARHVLLVTSGRMFGWWYGSLIFDYQAYAKALVEFAALLRKYTQPVQVVIKSHPVSDLHDLYDKLVAEHGDIFVQHRKEPMSAREIADFDAAVVFSAASAFIGEIIRVRLPLLYYSGALTDFGKQYCKYAGLEIAGDVNTLADKLRRLLCTSDNATRESVLKMQEDFLNEYVDPAQRSFAAVLDEVLHVAR